MAEALAELLRPHLDPLDDAAWAVPGEGRPAAVLVLLGPDPDGALATVLTRRRADLRLHPDQVSFPGGRPEPSDRDLVATALREAREEIGLATGVAQVVGHLAAVHTRVSGYLVAPVVATIPAGLRWTAQAAEVAEVLEWPLAALRAGRHRRPLPVQDGPPRDGTAFEVDGTVVWGATARILEDLLARVGPELDAPT